MGNVVGINVEVPLDKVVSCCWRQACATRGSFQSLTKDWERLRTARNDVLTKIELEERRHMRRLETVADWLSQVDAIEIEVDKLKTDISQQSVNKCFCGCCPRNCKTNYILGEKVDEIRKEVLSLLALKPDVIAESTLIAPVAERPAGPTIGMQSILDVVLSNMEDEQVGIIGLYGMGGVGKTTLLNEVHNKLCVDSAQRFDVVFWIVVSSTPNLTKVQNDIGKKLGFHDENWKDTSQEDKAVDIYNVLKGKKYVLFLDDVWKQFDLKDLGIPLPDQNNKSKVILTTRSKEVCGHMEAHKKIEVNCLGWEESWDLFRKKVGEDTLNADHPEIYELAKDVAKECDGLPLALITIGRSMACKTTPQAWHHAIELLRRYTAEFAGMGDQIFPRLKFSYDSIPNDAMRSCFLYCSLYPEDHLMSKQQLIDQWICEGFLDKFDDLHKARNEGYDYIDTLVHASLLEECSAEQIKMHDVIRDMAIWIACDCGVKKNKFFVQAGVGLTETPDVGEFEGSERMSVMENRIVTLTGTPKCHKLLTLFLNRSQLEQVDNGFFKSMPNLRVLDLARNRSLNSLPEEICELVSLQYLDLSRTNITELPINLRNLINLKWLNLTSVADGVKIPKGLLYSFKKLQVLILVESYFIGLAYLPETFVIELESLKYLNDLSISIRGDFELSSFSSSHKLMSITTRLDLSDITERYLDLLFHKKMTNLKGLNIRNCQELENLNKINEIINHNYYPGLRDLYINKCPKLKDVTSITFAPNLEHLVIDDCEGMGELIAVRDEDAYQEGRRPIPFENLRILRLYNAQNLKRIYPIALPFPCLEEMRVVGCPKLKKLPFNPSSRKSGHGITIRIEGQQAWWDELEWEDEATRIAFLPSFKKL